MTAVDPAATGPAPLHEAPVMAAALEATFGVCATTDCDGDPVPGTDSCAECISGQPDVIVEVDG